MNESFDGGGERLDSGTVSPGATDAATAHVAKAGLSSVTPEKLKQTIDSVVTAYALPNSPDPATVYTDRYLPPAAERMLAHP